MKPFHIAIKDLIRSFRSPFALVFMFGIPLMVTGMFYLMFGSMNQGGGFDVPLTKVVIANLDEGHPEAGQLGEMMVETLRSADFAGLMQVTTAEDAATARQAVESRQAGAAIIIPEGFSAAFTDPTAAATVEIYQDPTLTLGPGIVRSVLSQFTDHLAGVKITTALALKQAEAGAIQYAQIRPIVAGYLAAYPADTKAQSWIDPRTPTARPQKNLMLGLVGPIMGGMMIFYAFFTGIHSASSILKENEEGTLPRLFTTPTTQAEALGGKFMAVGLTVLVQVVVLLILARLIFHIEWGSLASVALAAFATICSAAAFGILVCSLLKNSRQGGLAFGGILSATGFVGMLDIFTGNPNSGQFGILPLLTPQGWAARGLLLSMENAPIAKILPYALVLLALSTAFFFLGVRRFQKRFL